MQLILVRHPAPAIAPGLCYGRLDIDLSPTGQAALIPMHTTLMATGIHRIITSPARRCLRLAQAITADPIIDPRLQELDFGAWEGLPWDQIPRHLLDAWAADPLAFAPPNGESGAHLIARLRSACTTLLEADTIVITHGGPLRLLPALLRGETPDLLGPAPPIGAILTLHVKQAIALNPAHSAATAHAPSTSPVNPPI